VSRAALLFLLLGSLPACRSAGWGPYAEPPVRGRVVDAASGRPLAGVRVTPNPVEDRFAAAGMKEGERQLALCPLVTGLDGRFATPGERVLAVVRHGGWEAIRLRLERPGYLPLVTNVVWSAGAATNGASGAGCLDLGDLRLCHRPARPS